VRAAQPSSARRAGRATDSELGNGGRQVLAWRRRLSVQGSLESAGDAVEAALSAWSSMQYDATIDFLNVAVRALQSARKSAAQRDGQR
jgi:hypothetical protein